MAPTSTVHLIRHAEGYHQLPRDHPDVQIRDALLTEKGVRQAKDFCEKFPYHDRTDLLCASPLQRTIQTAQHAFAPELRRGMTILAISEAQEAQDDPSSTGSPASQLRAVFSADLVDCHLLTEDWYRKEGINAYDDHALRERARKLRRLLRDRPEEHIVLVTHGLFAHYVTEHVDPEGHQTGERILRTRYCCTHRHVCINIVCALLTCLGEYWLNVMWRTFRFSTEMSEYAHLIETEESIARHPRRSVAS